MHKICLVNRLRLAHKWNLKTKTNLFHYFTKGLSRGSNSLLLGSKKELEKIPSSLRWTYTSATVLKNKVDMPKRNAVLKAVGNEHVYFQRATHHDTWLCLHEKISQWLSPPWGHRWPPCSEQKNPYVKVITKSILHHQIKFSIIAKSMYEIYTSFSSLPHTPHDFVIFEPHAQPKEQKRVLDRKKITGG